MAIQTFTAAQVLTAAQMNALQANDYNQTVSAKVASYTLVAADKGTRITMSNAAATTITVNTSLFAAGDSLRIQNIGVGACTITAGTATVTSAGPLAIAQWGGGQLYFTSASAAVWFPDAVTATPGGLTFITSGSFSGAVSASVNSCFTSTYRNYMIVINASSASANNSIDLRLRVSGTDSSTAYKSVVQYWDCNTAGAISAYARTTSFGMGYMNYGSATDRGQVVVTISAPQLAQPTSVNTYGIGSGDGTSQIASVCGGRHTTATAYDGFTIINVNGANIEGVYRVYGLADS